MNDVEEKMMKHVANGGKIIMPSIRRYRIGEIALMRKSDLPMKVVAESTYEEHVRQATLAGARPAISGARQYFYEVEVAD